MCFHSRKGAGKRGFKLAFIQGRVPERETWNVPSSKEGCRKERLGVGLHPRKGAGKRGLEWAFIQGRVPEREAWSAPSSKEGCWEKGLKWAFTQGRMPESEARGVLHTLTDYRHKEAGHIPQCWIFSRARDLNVCIPSTPFIVQELCESRGGRPGLSVLTSLLVSVDVKIY